jgi:hypothetical protein
MSAWHPGTCSLRRAGPERAGAAPASANTDRPELPIDRIAVVLQFCS